MPIILHNELETPGSRYLENAGLVLVVAYEVKKIPVLYETLLFIAVLSRANHWFLYS
jgi:hypothetical protein